MRTRAANLLIPLLAVSIGFLAGWQLRGEPSRVQPSETLPLFQDRVDRIPVVFPGKGSRVTIELPVLFVVYTATQAEGSGPEAQETAQKEAQEHLQRVVRAVNVMQAEHIAVLQKEMQIAGIEENPETGQPRYVNTEGEDLGIEPLTNRKQYQYQLELGTKVSALRQEVWSRYEPLLKLR